MTDNAVTSELSHQDYLAGAFKTAVAGLAVIAFCIQPVLPYINPDRFLGGGIFLAVGFLWCYERFAKNKLNWSAIPGFTLNAIGIYLLSTATIEASRASRINDVRCTKIERDMLSLKPKIQNGPDVFQALRCRPMTDMDAPIR